MTKEPMDRQFARMVREDLSRYQRSLEIARFGVELPEKTRLEIELGEKIGVVFNQDTEAIIPRSLQLILLGLLVSGFWHGKNSNLVKVDVVKLLQKFQKGGLKGIEKQILAVKTPEELSDLVKRYTSSITEALYV